jgi:hypothetical protein
LSAEMPMLLTMTSQGGTWDFQNQMTSLWYHTPKNCPDNCWGLFQFWAVLWCC